MRVNASLEKISNGLLHESKDGKRFYKNISQFLEQNVNLKDAESNIEEAEIGRLISVSVVID